MRQFIWISFDLGLKGDYEGMYTWLARNKARECGDSLACCWYEHAGDLLAFVTKDLRKSVEFNAKSRVYVIRLVQGRMKGTFVVGHRRAAPWAGYADTGDQDDDTDA